MLYEIYVLILKNLLFYSRILYTQYYIENKFEKSCIVYMYEYIVYMYEYIIYEFVITNVLYSCETFYVNILKFFV